MDSRTEITELIYKTCLRMDAKDFDGYLALCDTAFHYAITAFSPEIRKNMTWLEHDRAGMATLFANLPKHNSDHSLLSRHATVYTIEEQANGETAKVTSALQVFRTTLDGGATELFAVGKMTDLVQLSAAGALLLDRNIHLETRMIGFGFHIPF
ncbi:aromatic-ring-hydroxylating dioxygenase subunit beta [Glaciimonas sp. Gout2]|uniref:nuclear transport factor 2 family protein n=1 Tax=unclassified Glaciimonas TaxID=2644401 RepID=UPI002B22AC82|nr:MULTISPECIES: nuclear transport factor 2 family protein [unclassified Glaciimonas]MEB0012977.1 aromatic-ring-hydroxylating dioxygenase subunit beta [Glaciimonas sp. Cout2]MEB0082933.1 aromatic-ring-hydroxylating dioxygenase subunit beta [Glaciimonas sp. Gout2]